VDLGHLFRESMKGRTLGRAIQNFELSSYSLAGEGIDLGASTNHGSYYEYLKLDPSTRIEYCDLHPRSEGVLKVDLEAELPIPDESKDFVILNNVLGNIYNHGLCLRECHRVLKPGGELLGVVPFFHIFVPDPDDYFRFTESSLKRLFAEAGFTDVYIKPIGYGAFSACANACATLLKFDLLRFISYAITIAMDKSLVALAKLFYPGSNRGLIWTAKYSPIYYLFHVKK